MVQTLEGGEKLRCFDGSKGTRSDAGSDSRMGNFLVPLTAFPFASGCCAGLAGSGVDERVSTTAMTLYTKTFVRRFLIRWNGCELVELLVEIEKDEQGVQLTLLGVS